MIYNVWKQDPKNSNMPLIDAPWDLIGSVERDEEPEDVDWASAVKEATGRKLSLENDRGIWYMVLPEDRRP